MNHPKLSSSGRPAFQKGISKHTSRGVAFLTTLFLLLFINMSAPAPVAASGLPGGALGTSEYTPSGGATDPNAGAATLDRSRTLGDPNRTNDVNAPADVPNGLINPIGKSNDFLAIENNPAADPENAGDRSGASGKPDDLGDDSDDTGDDNDFLAYENGDPGDAPGATDGTGNDDIAEDTGGGDTDNTDETDETFDAEDAPEILRAALEQLSLPLIPTHTVTGAASLSAAMAATTVAGDYVILFTADVELTELWPVPAGVTVALTGAGVTLSGGAAGRFTNDGMLFLCDGLTLRADTAGALVSVSAGSAFTMSGGAITNPGGVGVSVSPGGAFTLADGAITGCVLGVSNAGATDMSGGVISANTGGGVYTTAGGAFTMTGGDVTGNTAEIGAGVRSDGGALTLAGGNITGNTAALFGGGLYVSGGAIHFRDASIRIHDNRAAAGGGLYMTTYGGVSFSAGGGPDFSGNDARTDAFNPPALDPARTDYPARFPWANPVSSGGSVFALSTEFATPFSNRDVNYLGNVDIRYASDKPIRGSLPAAGRVAVTGDETPAAYFIDATSPTALDGSAFLGWKLAGHIVAFENDAPVFVSRDTRLFLAGESLRPAVRVTLDAVWETRSGSGTGGGSGGRTPVPAEPSPTPTEPEPAPPPVTPDDGGDGEPQPAPTPEQPPVPTSSAPASGGVTQPRRGSVARPATVAQQFAPPPAVPRPSEPVAPAIPAPPALPDAHTDLVPVALDTQPAPSGNAFEMYLATTGLAPFGVPLASANGAWSLMNLLFVALSVLTAAFSVLRFLKKRRQDKIANGFETDLDNAFGEKDDSAAGGTGFAYTGLAAVSALACAVVFVMTENVSLPFAWLDRFSPLLLAIFAVCIALAALAERARKSEFDDDFDENIA